MSLEPNLNLSIHFSHGSVCGIHRGLCPAGCDCACHRVRDLTPLVEAERRRETRPVLAGHPAQCACGRCFSVRERSVAGDLQRGRV